MEPFAHDDRSARRWARRPGKTRIKANANRSVKTHCRNGTLTASDVTLLAMLLAIFALLLGIRVTGSSDCPTPLQVEQAYAAMAAPRSEQRGHHVRIEVVADEVVMSMTSPQGTQVGERRLPRTDVCEDLAAAFAVSLATWQHDVPFTYSPALAELIETPSEPEIVSWNLGFGMGAGATAVLDLPLWRALVLARWRATAAGSIRMSLAMGGEQSLSLGAGQARWRRTSLGVGWEHAVGRSPNISLFGSAIVAWLQVRGEGFMSNRSDGALDPGAELGVHWLLHRFSSSNLWVDGGAAVWPRAHQVLTPADQPVASLPISELFVRLGLSSGP